MWWLDAVFRCARFRRSFSVEDERMGAGIDQTVYALENVPRMRRRPVDVGIKCSYIYL